MFEHLPQITEDSLRVMVETEFDYFVELTKQSVKATRTLPQAIDYACRELDEVNPVLFKAVRAAAFGVAGMLAGSVKPGVESQAAIVAVPGILAALRLIDRALEAKEMERSLGTVDSARGN